MTNHKNFIVFSKEHYNSLGIIRSLGKNGIQPIYVAIDTGKPASSMSMYIKELHKVRNKEEGLELLIQKYGNEKNKPFILTSDDETQQMLDENYSRIKDLFVFFNAGGSGIITKYMDKMEVLRIARENGISIPNTIVVERGIFPRDISYPVITKSISPNVGGWKSDVHICHSENDLTKAFETIKSPQVIVQDFIDKKNECCIEGISINSGEDVLIPMAIRYNYVIQGYYSPYMTAYAFNDQGIIKKISDIVRQIGFEGLFDAEFIVDKQGKMYFTEFNFRNSIWNYIGTYDNTPFPIIWAEGMVEGRFGDKWNKSISREMKAMVEPIDYGIRVKKGNTSLAEWMKDFRESDVLFYYDKEDVKPFEEMMSNWMLYS